MGKNEKQINVVTALSIGIRKVGQRYYDTCNASLQTVNVEEHPTMTVYRN